MQYTRCPRKEFLGNAKRYFLTPLLIHSKNIVCIFKNGLCKYHPSFLKNLKGTFSRPPYINTYILFLSRLPPTGFWTKQEEL